MSPWGDKTGGWGITISTLPSWGRNKKSEEKVKSGVAEQGKEFFRVCSQGIKNVNVDAMENVDVMAIIVIIILGTSRERGVLCKKVSSRAVLAKKHSCGRGAPTQLEGRFSTTRTGTRDARIIPRRSPWRVL